MKYFGMPLGMWLLYHKSFQARLVDVVGLSEEKAKETARMAKPFYKAIIRMIPPFERGDMFQMNLVNCALFSSFYLSLKSKPSLKVMTEYYERAMGIHATKWFCRKGGKKKFAKGTYRRYERVAAFKAADRNPYSWNMEFLPYGDGSGYECRFTHCGICRLMKELGIGEVIPAMCHLDYAMSEWGGASRFIREHTLASGGPYCDCGYKKK